MGTVIAAITPMTARVIKTSARVNDLVFPLRGGVDSMLVSHVLSP